MSGEYITCENDIQHATKAMESAVKCTQKPTFADNEIENGAESSKCRHKAR